MDIRTEIIDNEIKNTGEQFKDCQVAMEYMEKSVNCHAELVEALKLLVNRCIEMGAEGDYIERAKKALLKAGEL